MREITSHIINPVNDKHKITVLDEPGQGGANHVYAISGMALQNNEAAMSCPEPEDDNAATIIFQCGGIADHGVNGITQEALLAIVIDRLECFQNGPFASVYNAKALDYARAAQEALLDRTRERMVRGVEGKSIA